MDFILFPIFFFWITVVQAEDNGANAAALAECGNLHKLEFHNIPNAEAVYSNSNCALKCAVGEKVLSNDSLNEGFACPLNANGLCHSGQCVENGHSKNEAVRECANLHRIDFLKLKSTGTLFSESQCFLKCVINGNTISTNSMNEGFPCPENYNGTCRNGRCVPNPPILSTHHVADVEIEIHGVNFTTDGYYGAKAFACVEESPQGELLIGKCRRYCSSDMINKNTKIAHWNTKCNWSGPFTEKDFISIHIQHTHGDAHLVVGTLSKNLFALLQHNSINLKSVPERLRFDDKFVIEHNGLVTGDVNLSFVYVLTKVQ